MIIAAYAGTGKSTFAARFPNAADVVSMPHSWILPPADQEKNEQEKGHLDRLPDPLYPENYLLDILKAEQEYDYVLIPTSIYVIYRLSTEYGRKVVLCYPADELKDEYCARFQARGNSEGFLDLFINQWDRFLQPVQEFEDAIHIVMQPGEYLTDLKERLDQELLSDDTEPISEEVIEELEQELESMRYDYALQIGNCFRYRIPDLLDPDERSFLAGIADRVHEDGLDIAITIVSISDQFISLPEETVITDDRAQVLRYLERYGR